MTRVGVGPGDSQFAIFNDVTGRRCADPKSRHNEHGPYRHRSPGWPCGPEVKNREGESQRHAHLTSDRLPTRHVFLSSSRCTALTTSAAEMEFKPSWARAVCE